ncbi:MAG TPA: type II CAAX endopeptidase family protein [Thermoleophilaceae bacterium]|jgi:membrane protease YdiL (CAAX protease family)
MDATITPPPPNPPELPESAAPRWPAWYAGVAFVVGIIGTLIVVTIVSLAAGVDVDAEDPAFTIVATLIQSAIFIGTALLFASMTAPPRPWQFGLRRTALWPAVGWAALGLVAFYVFAAVYSAILQPDADQTVAQDLGADSGTFGLVAAGFMVVCVAPFAEEFFFRGFFYKALRTRFPVLVAAIIDGGLFGVIHFSGNGTEEILLPLALLGFTFCLVYERTGSIFPVIAMHSINNSIAFAAQTDGWAVSVVLGPLVILACMVVPRFARPAAVLR